MNPISTRSFPKQPPAKRSWGKPRTPAGAPGPEAVSRHLRWAEGITSRLGRHVRWAGLRLETMTLAYLSLRRIVRLRKLKGHTHSQTRLLYTPAREREAIGRFDAVPTLAASPQGAAPVRTIVERNHSTASFVHEIVHRTTSVAASLTAIRSNRRVEFSEKSAASRIARSSARSGEQTTLLALSPVRRATPQSNRLQEEFDPASAPLPERVLRKLRRIEARPFLRSREAASQIQAVLSPEPVAVIHRSPARRSAPHRFDEVMEAASRQQSAPQAPQMNLAQITDAVLQQLDRRLIGARERMGRI